MRNGASQHSGKLRVAMYGRVSTSDQNVETQMEALRAYCGRMGYEVAGEYVDNGFSGKDDRRPEFEAGVKLDQQVFGGIPSEDYKSSMNSATESSAALKML